jgi:hypothetical protein
MTEGTKKAPCGCCGGSSTAPGAAPGGINSQCYGFTSGVTPHWRIALDGYLTNTGQLFSSAQQHVNYVDNNGHVRELFFDGSTWHDNDLFDSPISAGELPSNWAASMNAIDGYPTDWNNQQHVNYIGAGDGHVHELFFDGSTWHDNDLFKLAGIATDSQGNNNTVGNNNTLEGYPTPWNQQQHVNYIGEDDHVHELFFDGSTWHDNDLFKLAGIPQASVAINSALDSYAGPDQQQHVNYIGQGGVVNELFFDGNSWHSNDLFELAGNIPGSFLGPIYNALNGYAGPNQQQHVNWVDGNGHVRELFFDGSTWHDNDLFKSPISAGELPSNAAANISTSALHGYAGPNQQQHVHYIGATDSHVHELFFDGSTWHDNDLFKLAGNPQAQVVAINSALYSYLGPETSLPILPPVVQQHVNYVTPDGHAHELVFDGSSWHDNDLSGNQVVIKNPVMTVLHPQIVPIYWDTAFAATPNLVTSMDQFLSDLATGDYWAGLSQYGVGTATVAPNVVINVKKFPTPNSQNPGVKWGPTQLQNWLVARLQDGTVTPTPDSSGKTVPVYLIFPPKDTAFVLPGATNFCGYHQHGKFGATTSLDPDNLVWATVPSYNTSDFVGDSNSSCGCVSHELSEAFSNPTGLGWYTSNGCEIGDLCEATPTIPCCITVPYTVSGRTYRVEKYWSNLDKGCITEHVAGL